MKLLTRTLVILTIAATSALFSSQASALTDTDCSNIPKLEEATKGGDLQSQTDLGICYFMGKDVEKSPQKAFDLFQRAADAGFPLAMRMVGMFYERGMVVDKDYKLAMEWYLKAADKNLPNAQFAIGQMYLAGRGVEKNYKTAIEWFEKAKQQNFPNVYPVYSMLHQYGLGVEKDENKAFEYLRKAAELGLEKRVAHSLSNMYLQGKGTLKDQEKSFEWAKLNAEAGHPKALSHLAKYYEEAIGTPRNVTKAAELYEQAAAKGDRDSKYTLMNLYFVGSADLKRDLKKARKWATALTNDTAKSGYQKSAKKILQDIEAEERGEETSTLKNVELLEGLSPKTAPLKLTVEADCSNVGRLKDKAQKGDQKSLIDLSVCYTNGDGVAQSDETGFGYAMKAAEFGSPMGSYIVGIYYNVGSFVKKDAVEAAKWYLKAANDGLANAQHMMGVFHMAGTGVPKNASIAMQWFEKAIEQKYTPSLIYLGRQLSGPFAKDKKALEASFAYYAKALEYGDMNAAYPLSQILKEGKGVPKDEKQAFELAERYLETGAAFAYQSLSEYYLKGIGTEKNIKKAVALLETAADMNDQVAMLTLMNLFYEGQELAEDVEKARKWAEVLSSKSTDWKKAKADELLKKIKAGK